MERTRTIELYLWRYLQSTLLPTGMRFGVVVNHATCASPVAFQSVQKRSCLAFCIVVHFWLADLCSPLQNGIHYVRFLVDGVWQVSADMPTAKDGDGIPCNVISVHARDNFAVYYKTGWRSSELQYRVLDRDGLPTSAVCPHLCSVSSSLL